MAKYVYITTCGGPVGWVDNDRFDCLSDQDNPAKYDNACKSLASARHYRLNKLILQPQLEFITMKFDAKPPYLYHGLVQ
jgi:hypothetical protein